MSKVSAVVWDMDGTPIDSAAAIAAAFAVTVAELGGPSVNTSAVKAAYPLGVPEVIRAHLSAAALAALHRLIPGRPVPVRFLHEEFPK